MSDFIVSARKYRPATFRSVVGQKHITSTLQNAIERGQLAHAYLFCGPRGVGKTTCARIFAKAINCLAPHGAEACNECESCRSFNEGRSLNIHELDAASNNSVEDIRTLIEQVRIIPQVGRYSVFIIDEVHMLSAAAFNAFLKTLEEPPAHAIFILATTEKHKIIPTILSRCQIYDFNRIRVEDSVEYLRYIASEEGVAADEESLNLIAQKADGGMRDALSMFDKAVSFCGTTLDYRNVAQTLNVLDYDTYFGVTEMLLRGDYAEALVTFDAVLSKGFSGQTFMAGLNRHMRDLLMAERPETLRLIEMTGTLLERYRTQAGACSVEFLFGAISVLTELDGKIRQSSNQRLLVELGLMKIAGLGQKKNDLLTPSGEYPLPELTPRTAAPAARAETQPAPPPPASGTEGAANAARLRPEPAPAAEGPHPEPSGRAAPSPEPAAASGMRPDGNVPPAAAPATASGTAPATRPGPAAPIGTEVPAADTRPAAAPQPVPQPEARPAGTARRPLISGTSLSDLLASAGNPATQSEKTQDPEPAAATVDPECAAKLERTRERILALIRERRPRFVPAFEQMLFRGDTIAVSVPTTELRDEILRSKTGMLMRIAELAGVTGRIELEITVNEQIRAARPIRLEDRVKYITEKNPLVAELRKALDLEVE
ncbi:MULTISPECIES: DNA polymerase III subunit gamma/tau [Alistipes]|uniref:DNA polymerase III subunit gamma/tau n=1 Tax=Alistipes TaxID=239759 RepID=UPI001B39945A|nr:MULTISPECIES: DNA polymerase III subunit gamma/tau [Alistipes]MBQ4902859.1 DNA polymerase III subunit gamma/tau [Alistipes sp. Marseille-P2263]MCI2258616.1 DNA polymerase III subunit gamma/tau [Alistipes dispar]